MRVLLVGAYGQVGQQLIRALSNRIPMHDIVCADIKQPPSHLKVAHHYTFNALDKQNIYATIKKHQISQIYCLAALLSVTGERDPQHTQKLNMGALFNCLEAARELKVDRMFWPSSIAAFGTNTPKDPTPQFTIMEPSTVYGITKKSGQLWCSYYNKRYGVDVRSLRYPGLVGYRSDPGGGTTDYAVDIFHKAKRNQVYTCYLKQDSYLPMIYTDDAIDATIQLMDAPTNKISVRTSYNLQGITFCPREIANQIRKHLPNFQIKYQVDPIKQAIADSWPKRLDDGPALSDWGWKPKFGLSELTKEILNNLKV